jgi:CcmD family protein
LFRTSGKIYIVVGIIAIIFLLILLYLVRLDKRITEIENN